MENTEKWRCCWQLTWVFGFVILEHLNSLQGQQYNQTHGFLNLRKLSYKRKPCCMKELCYYQMSRDMTKPTKWLCTQRRLRSAWASAQSDQSLRCQHKESLGPSLPIQRTAKTDQTGRMPRLIWVFAGRTLILLVLSCRGSNDYERKHYTVLISIAWHQLQLCLGK